MKKLFLSNSKLFIGFAALFYSLISIAQEAVNPLAIEKEKPLVASYDYVVLFNYSPADLLIPNKFGFTFGFIRDEEQTWEVEYLKGSLSVPFVIEDLGSMTDQRFSIISRSFISQGSFNFSYGISYHDFSIHLGDKLLNRVTGGSYPSIDLVQIQSLGFNLGIGNRWTFDRDITFGVDWIAWAQPVSITNRNSDFLNYSTNQEDRDDVEKAIQFISYFPRLSFLKLQLGMSF